MPTPRTEHILQTWVGPGGADVFPDRDGRGWLTWVPASSSWCEAEGTVTNSKQQVQRVRKALEPPGNAGTTYQE